LQPIAGQAIASIKREKTGQNGRFSERYWRCGRLFHASKERHFSEKNKGRQPFFLRLF
jgi:hypothetical protein